ncbi:predicted protein [Histoplasma capsulatum H143]|uniref:Uncharacterized protein n=1 Tax=Ajellomyces capsulatus (strain H143) TaxID=544712 RepID=C6HRC1_AJECH|nr:predicted protein [Histoplasma capsulatum H143]
MRRIAGNSESKQDEFLPPHQKAQSLTQTAASPKPCFPKAESLDGILTYLQLCPLNRWSFGLDHSRRSACADIFLGGSYRMPRRAQWLSFEHFNGSGGTMENSLNNGYLISSSMQFAQVLANDMPHAIQDGVSDGWPWEMPLANT